MCSFDAVLFCILRLLRSALGMFSEIDSPAVAAAPPAMHWKRRTGGVGGCGEYFGHVYAVFRLLKAVCVCLLQEGVPGYVLLPAKSELLRFLLRHPFIIPSSNSRVQHGRCSQCKYYHQIYKMSHR